MYCCAHMQIHKRIHKHFNMNILYLQTNFVSLVLSLMKRSYIALTNGYPLFQGHSSFIRCLDFSVDGAYIQTNSGDYEHLFCKLL